MSRVTNIIFICSCSETYELEKLRSFFDRKKLPNLQKIENCSVGGNKCLEAEVFIGAYNYFGDKNEFIEYVKRQEWSSFRDCIQILIKEEEDEWFTIHTPFCTNSPDSNAR